MPDPTDDQLLAEAERLRQADAGKRLPWWPFFYCVLPILVALGLIVFVNRPSNNDGRANENKAPGGIPDLGHTGRPLVKNNAPVDDNLPGGPADGVKDSPPDSTDPPKDGSVDRPPPPLSDFEIEIAIRNIQSGVKNQDRRTVASAQQWLRDNADRGPVAQRITVALESEPLARVRLALFEALVDLHAREQWALKVYRLRTAMFMGSEVNYADGEIEELKACFPLIAACAEGPALMRNGLRTEKPLWMLEVLAARLSAAGAEEIAGYGPDIFDLLRRASAPEGLRESLFGAWLKQFEQAEILPHELRAPAMLAYLPAALTGAAAQPYLGELLQFVAQVLGATDVQAPLKGRVIAALARAELRERPAVTEILQAGVARKDANYPDYLALLGLTARTVADLDLLRAAANDPKPEIARGAVVGLKNARGAAADLRLREILNEGSNDGVKADAFAALIERNPRDSDKLVEEYLGEAKPVALRVIAVAHVRAKDVARLQELAQDPHHRVREAAIHRLGAMKDKKLRPFLKRISNQDSQAVLRQLAAKYAAELE